MTPLGYYALLFVLIAIIAYVTLLTAPGSPEVNTTLLGLYLGVGAVALIILRRYGR